MRRGIALLGIGLLLLATSARGARRPYAVAYDAATIAEGDVEIETWLDFISNPKSATDEWRWWMGPRWSPHDGVEVAFLTILTQGITPPSQGGSSTQFWATLAEGRWHAASLGGALELTLQLDLRIAMANDLPHQLSPSIVLSRRRGRLGVAAEVGYAAGFAGPTPATDRYDWVVWSGGAALDIVRGEVAPAVQLGVEGFGELTLNGTNDLTDDVRSTANVGPVLSVAHGRLWLTAAALFGGTDASPSLFVRGIVGVSL